MSESKISGPSVPQPTTTDDPERRRELRVPLRVLKVKTEFEGETFFGYAVNLSTTGLYIQTSNPKPPGTRVRLVFQLPSGGAKINCVAEVMWSRNFAGAKAPAPGMGLRFIEISPECGEQVEKYIDGA